MGANAGGLDTGKFAFGWGGAATTDVVAGDAGNEGNTGKGDAATSNALKGLAATDDADKGD
eukprot:4707872-Pleurochrysis_carterae.AAC.1